MPSKNAPATTYKFHCSFCDFNCHKKRDYDRHILTVKHMKYLAKIETGDYMDGYFCDCCDFSSNNKYNYDKHLKTSKHAKNALLFTNDNDGNHMVQKMHKYNAIVAPYDIPSDTYTNVVQTLDEKMKKCPNGNFDGNNGNFDGNEKDAVDYLICHCGKKYNFSSGLSRHKKTCVDSPSHASSHTPNNTSLSLGDSELIHKIVHGNQEFQTQTLQNNQEFQAMMLNMFKECMQNTNKTTEMFVEALPKMGNNVITSNTNSNNNSNNTNNINYYLNVTCQNAETDLDFLEQWKERCIEMFHEKKLLMAERKISFPNMCTDAYFKQIKSKPQTQRFIQTTNWKDGRVYVNTAKLDEDKNPTGESEFVLHEDGLESVTNHMSHALGKSILEHANKEVEEKYFEENRKFNIFSRQPTTPEIEWKRDMTGGLMIGTSEVFNILCSPAARTKIMKATHKE